MDTEQEEDEGRLSIVDVDALSFRSSQILAFLFEGGGCAIV